MIRIKSVTPLEKYWVHLEFTNGEQKDVDLELFLRGAIFEPIKKDIKQFRSIRVDKELGTIVWENGADIDPDVLYGDKIPEWMEPQYNEVE